MAFAKGRSRNIRRRHREDNSRRVRASLPLGVRRRARRHDEVGEDEIDARPQWISTLAQTGRWSLAPWLSEIVPDTSDAGGTKPFVRM